MRAKRLQHTLLVSGRQPPDATVIRSRLLCAAGSPQSKVRRLTKVTFTACDRAFTFAKQCQNSCADSLPFVVTRQSLAYAPRAPHFCHSLRQRDVPIHNAINTLQQTRVTGGLRASPTLRSIHRIDIRTRLEDHEIRRLLFKLGTSRGPRHKHLPELWSLPEDMRRRRERRRCDGHDRRQQLLVRRHAASRQRQG